MKATKNFIALITNFMLIIVMCSQMMVFAADIDNIEWTLRYGGDCGKSSQSVKWQYHTHNQSVSDKYYNNRFTLTAGYGQDGGVMENYVYKNYDFYSQFLSSGTRKWNSLTTSMYMINIEEGMKVIGDHAFNFCIYANGISPSIIPYAEDTSSNVHYISLPSTLEEIGFLGFAGALKYVDTLTLPANLSTLDYGSFCSNGFKTVVIEEGNLTTLPSYCFANCTSLEEIYIPKTVKKIDSSAFMGCTSLKKIHYGGYSEDWENVTISGDNDALLSAQVMFPIRVHVSSVTLNTTSKTLMAGNTYTLVATVLPSNADITDVEWTSSKPNVATVSSDGIVTAVSAGTTTITATSVEGGIKANCTISVQAANIAVTGISLNKTSTTMNIGATETLTATVSPSNATNKSVTWKSSNTNVASVTNGIITAKATGTATITATTVDGSKVATCTVTVIIPTVSVASVSLNKTSTTLDVGTTETLVATVSPSNATNQSITWSSSNTSVASVSSNGVVTAKAAGTATITATTVDGNKTATCTVVVENQQSSGDDEICGLIKVNDAKSCAGKIVDVVISIENNPGIAILGFNVNYDKTAMTLKSATLGEIFTGELECNINAVPFVFNVYSGSSNKTNNGKLVTLQFEIKSDCVEGDYTISLTSIESLNIAEEDVFFDSINGKVTVSTSIPGDVTGDGNVTRADLLRLAKSFSGFDVDMDMVAADVTGDGNVTRADLLRLAKYFSGFDVALGE